MEDMNIKMEDKEMAKMEKMADSNRKISKEEFISYSKHSKCVKDYVEKGGHSSSSSRFQADPVKIDKAMAAFRVRTAAWSSSSCSSLVRL